MIYVHDTIKFRSLVKLPISFQIYKDKWLFNFIHNNLFSRNYYNLPDSDNKVFKVFNKIKKKNYWNERTSEMEYNQSWEIEQEKYEIKL